MVRLFVKRDCAAMQKAGEAESVNHTLRNVGVTLEGGRTRWLFRCGLLDALPISLGGGGFWHDRAAYGGLLLLLLLLFKRTTAIHVALCA